MGNIISYLRNRITQQQNFSSLLPNPKSIYYICLKSIIGIETLLCKFTAENKTLCLGITFYSLFSNLQNLSGSFKLRKKCK